MNPNHTRRRLLKLGLSGAGLLAARGLHAADGDLGTLSDFRVPLTGPWRQWLDRDPAQPSPVREALVTLALPNGFKPGAKAWPTLVVSATSDPGSQRSRQWLPSFAEPALEAGWIALAADPLPEEVPASADTNELRWTLIEAALAALKKRWPAAGTWPLAFAGFSGGAKRSGVMAALSTARGRLPVGIFLGGCNQATPALAAGNLPAGSGFTRVPVYLSSGEADTVATPQQHADGMTALREAGFTRLRLESHDGGHRLHAPHVAQALGWFLRGGTG